MFDNGGTTPSGLSTFYNSTGRPMYFPPDPPPEGTSK